MSPTWPQHKPSAYLLVTLSITSHLPIGRPLTSTHLTPKHECRTCKIVRSYLKLRFWPGDLDLWPMTLKLKVTLGGVHIDVLAKFHGPKFNTFEDMNYCPVNFGQVTDDRLRTEYDAYEPTVRVAQVGSKILIPIHWTSAKKIYLSANFSLVPWKNNVLLISSNVGATTIQTDGHFSLDNHH